MQINGDSGADSPFDEFIEVMSSVADAASAEKKPAERAVALAGGLLLATITACFCALLVAGTAWVITTWLG